MRTIVVSGSASGIGAAIRGRLERDGDKVVGVDLRDAEVCADLSTPAGRQAAIDGVHAATAGRVDGLATFAGVGPHLEPALQARVNYFATIAMLEGLRPALIRGSSPCAVAVSSVAATIAPVDDALVEALLAGDEMRAVELIDNGGVGYASAKRAIATYVRRAAPRWITDGVRLNAIAPGNTNTPLMAATLADPVFGAAMQAVPVPLGRFAEPDEIADAVAWMMRPSTTYLVGAFVVVDGGTDALVRPDQF